MADEPARDEAVEMPRPTAAPLVLSLGLVLLAAGVATNRALSVVGAVVVAAGLARWISYLLPGRGHWLEPLVPVEQRARPIVAAGRVDRLRPGQPGHRLRLPEHVHPISAGIKGGIVGGIVMPLPALAWGSFSGHGIWYPVNLLAGMALPGVGQMTVAELEQFSPSLLLLASIIHVTMAVVVGLIYGVLMPTLPEIPKPLAWGGLLMPLLWTAVSYLLMGQVNPALTHRVDWLWFVVSQFVFGVVAALVVMRDAGDPPVLAGLKGGWMGGMLMPLPALLWSLANGHGVWFPVNLLAGTLLPGLDQLPEAELKQFHADWFWIAVAIHAAASTVFGIAYGLWLARVRPIPAALAWGGLLMPLLWTGASYSLMGVVNPVLQQRVDWPWFVVSQFIFGLAAAWVVVRSEMIYIPPAGTGEDSLVEYVKGD